MSNHTLKVKVSGLHCKACELLSEEKLSALPGVQAVRVSHHRGQAEIDYQDQAPDLQLIRQQLQALGYDLDEKLDNSQTNKAKLNWRELLLAAAIASAVSAMLKLSGFFQISDNINPETLSWGGVWLIGLVAGVSTCMALVGGIVMALATDYAQRHPEASRVRKFMPHLYFNTGRLIGFFVLGGLLGAAGSILKISPLSSAWLTLIIGLIIILLGLQIIEVFPALQRFNITLPKSIAKIIPTNTRNRHYRPLGAMIAGALSFFLPCGFTQSMQLYALSSGNFFNGAIIMALFSLGTAPGFLSLGGLISLIKGKHRSLFLKTAGLIVILFGLFNFTNAYKILRLHSVGNIAQLNLKQSVIKEIQTITMTQDNRGYTPNQLEVEVNKPVRWIIISTTPYSCASSLVVPALKINQQLKKGENIIEFTPTQTGLIKFSCSMGMYSGTINVRPTGTAIPANTIVTENRTETLPVCNINGCK